MNEPSPEERSDGGLESRMAAALDGLERVGIQTSAIVQAIRDSRDRDAQ